MATLGPDNPTISQLVDTVLQNLGVKESGQPTSAEDSAAVIFALTPKLEELNARDVGYIDPNNIDNVVILSVAWILARELSGTFNVSDPKRLQLLEKMGAKDGESEQTIKDVLRLRLPRQNLRCEIFSGRRYYGGRW